VGSTPRERRTSELGAVRGGPPGSKGALPVAYADDCGALDARARASGFPASLQDGEEVLKEGPAALARQAEPAEGALSQLLRALRSANSTHAGHLYLTSRRLLFVPTQQRDQALTLEVALTSIESAHVCSIAIRRGLALTLQRGARHYFLVRRPEEWMAVLVELTGLDPSPPGAGQGR
jgi:hypothetical protein